MVLIIGAIIGGAKKLFGGAKKPTRESIGEGISMATQTRKAEGARATEARKVASAPAKAAPRRTPTAVKRAIAANRTYRKAKRAASGRY